jgi:hypothetical protein
MRNLIKILLLTIFAVTNVFAQEKFVSADGGFAIDLPKIFSSSKDYDSEYKDLFTDGKIYYWEKAVTDPFYAIQYTKYQSTDFGKPTKLTLKNKSEISTAVGKAYIEKAKELKSMYRETAYSYEQFSGKELLTVNSTSKTLIRMFFVRNTFYSVICVFSVSDDEDNIRKILDSFRLLTRQEIIDIKVKEAEPKPLPQSPVSDKPFSDAHDENLKGKVKFIVEEYQETPKSKRQKSTEFYYNEQGNLTRKVNFQFGYTSFITVWGYIDRNRVTSGMVTDISFDDDPPQLVMLGDPAPNRPAKDAKMLVPDERYDTKFVYKYNDSKQLIEKTRYKNDGQISLTENYTYKGNQRETIEKDADSGDISKSTQTYDRNGNLIKEVFFNEKGRIESSSSFTYELDTKGNWIVQKSFDNVKIKGKTVLKPSSITYRTITYYE